MTGKELCNLLRQIRRKIAETNEIEYLSADCHNEEECLGTCPKCDAELSVERFHYPLFEFSHFCMYH